MDKRNEKTSIIKTGTIITTYLLTKQLYKNIPLSITFKYRFLPFLMKYIVFPGFVASSYDSMFVKGEFD